MCVAHCEHTMIYHAIIKKYDLHEQLDKKRHCHADEYTFFGVWDKMSELICRLNYSWNLIVCSHVPRSSMKFQCNLIQSLYFVGQRLSDRAKLQNDFHRILLLIILHFEYGFSEILMILKLMIFYYICTSSTPHSFHK